MFQLGGKKGGVRYKCVAAIVHIAGEDKCEIRTGGIQEYYTSAFETIIRSLITDSDYTEERKRSKADLKKQVMPYGLNTILHIIEMHKF